MTRFHIFENFNDILIYYKKKIIIYNTKLIMKEANQSNISKQLSLKIKNECDYKDLEFNQVLDKIKKDYMYATFFAKDPIKQNLAEKLQFKLLKLKYPNIKKLPNNGKNSIYINDGHVLYDIKNKNSKSIDFIDNINNTFFYAKYINERGGSQDNQFEDCKKFLKDVSMIKSINFKLIVDGNYFTYEKICILKNLIQNKNVYIESSFDKICFIKEYEKSKDILFLDISLDSL